MSDGAGYPYDPPPRAVGAHLLVTFALQYAVWAVPVKVKVVNCVFVPQVEAYRKDLVDLIFADTSLTFSEFVWGGGVSQRSHFAPKVGPRRRVKKEEQLPYTQACFWHNPVVCDFWKESFDVSNDDIHFQHRVYR